MKQVTGYMCSGCGTIHRSEKYIVKCKECGEEICEECSSFDDDYCEDCYEELFCNEDDEIPKSLLRDMIICNPDLE